MMNGLGLVFRGPALAAFFVMGAAVSPLPARPIAAAPRCGPAQRCGADHFCGSGGRCISAVESVVAGAGHTCALHHDGRVSCWGYADAVKGTTGAVSGAVEMAGLDAVRALSAGHHETCAVVGPAGRVRCFGLQNFGLAKDDGQPLTGATAVALGTGFGCARTADGISCWGRNESGQLARPSRTAGSPNAVLSLPGTWRWLGGGLAAVVADGRGGAGQICAWGNNASHLVPAAGEVGAVAKPLCAPGRDVAELAVGAAHACVRHARGTFACWGERYYGQLGNGAGHDKADVLAPGQTVSLPAPARQIAAGAGHTCVLVEGGRIFCFGLNSAGQIGEGPDQVFVPRARTGLHGKAIAIGSGSAARHTCAVLADGSVDCWGNDDAGQLGGGAKTLQEGRFSRVPVHVAF